MRFRAFATLAALSLGFQFAPAHAQTEEPFDALSGRGANGGRGDALADLQSVLDPRTPPEIGSNSIAFYTRPYGTEYRGLCRRDVLILNYGYEMGDQGTDSVHRPYQLRVIPTFHFLRRNVKYLDLDYRVRDIAKGECPAFHDPKAAWLQADNAYLAVFGQQAMQAVAARIRAGTLESLSCVAMESWDESCEKTLLTFTDSEHYNRVDDCKIARRNRCIAIHVASITVEITVDLTDEPVKPEDIEAVHVEDEGIVVT